MKFNDVKQHLDSLPQAELDSIYDAATSRLRFRIECIGMYIFMFGAVLYSVTHFAAGQAFRTFEPWIIGRLIVLLISLSAIWFGVHASFFLVGKLIDRSVVRELRRRGFSLKAPN